jgi:hypothetical protein
VHTEQTAGNKAPWQETSSIAYFHIKYEELDYNLESRK